MTEKQTALAARLKAARQAAGYRTALQFAETFNIPAGTYAGHEAGTRGIARDVAINYARLLKVSLEWLLTGHGDGPQKGVAEEQAGYAHAPRMIEIPALDVRASAGGGATVETEEENGRFGFPASEFDVGPDQLRIITVIGDSMQKAGDPSSLQPGDRVVVNLAMKAPSPPGIFALWDGVGLVVKCLEPVAGKPKRLRVFSLNTSYREYELSASEAHIQGRIVGVWRRV